MPFGIIFIKKFKTMADDINKKILIQVEAETDQLKKNVTDLNQTLDSLLQKQKQLTDAGLQNTKAFQDMAVQVKTAQTAIESHSKAIENNVKAIDSSNTTLQKNKDLMVSLLQQHDSLSKSEGDHSEKIKTLNTQISTLSNTITDQITSLTKSREVFDVHKATVNALSSSFDKLKGVSGTFGPSLEEAAKGFETLKSGLSIVQTGFTGVGEAIKTTGFSLLVLVLQSLVDYFTKTTEGSKQLRGAISAVGQVIEIIHKAFAGLGKIIVDAVTHPVESFKALGNMIKENIINRFKAFSVILDGIIHLDFKKIANGAVQAFTGVTDATDKIGTGFNAVKKGVEDTANQMVTAYKNGYEQAGKHVDDHEDKVKRSVERQIKYYKDLADRARAAYQEQDKSNNQKQPDDGPLTAVSGGPPTLSNNNLASQPAGGFNTTIEQSTADKTVKKEKTALQQVEDYAKQSAGKIATDALNVLNKSIKQQSDAKIANLEKDKAAELSNNSLTSAQKLAIAQKYKQQEGKIKLKAFKQEQEASVAQAVINGAIAITKAEAQTGVLGAIAIPVIIAETAIQIAAITSQKPPAYAKGGLHYKSDGYGGVLPGYSKTDNTNAYLRSGEGIVVSEAMQVPWARNLVSAINVGFGGRDFSITNPGRGYAVGGIFTDGNSR
ncbi:MAG: hypothetical protein JWQ63_2376 [Mucilaginibacter sp.]|nr:hypothetical protein [Mucilaginibacter sp.]